MESREIAQSMGVEYTRGFKRRLRAIAEEAAPRIVSWPGSPGYILWEFATNEQLDRCDDATASQIKVMTRRLVAYRKARASRYRPPANEQPSLSLS